MNPQESDERSEEQRRRERHVSGLLVQLVLYSEQEERLAEPVMAIVRDVNRHGAGLLLKQARSGSHHLFYEPLDKRCRLFLEVEDEPQKLTLPVQPVWYRLDEEEQTGSFRMGIEFSLPADDSQVKRLEKLAKASLGMGQGWLAALMEKLG